MTNEQEIVWSVFGVYLNDLKAYSTKPDRPTFKRLEEVRDRAIKALEQQPCEDCISRQATLDIINFEDEWLFDANSHNADTKIAFSTIKSKISEMPSVTPQTRWIPVSERLPEDLQTVNVTWVNHEPEPYYHDIKDKSFVATAIFSKRTGHWYWYSTTCADYLGEYGENEIDKVDDAIEIVAWQPLPQPYKAESEMG